MVGAGSRIMRLVQLVILLSGYLKFHDGGEGILRAETARLQKKKMQ